MNNVLKTGIVTGLLLGVVYFGIALLIYAMGLNPLGRYYMMFLPVYALAMILGMLYFRSRYTKKGVQAWQSVSIALLTNVLGSLMYAALLYLWLSYADSQMLQAHQAAFMLKINEVNPARLSKEEQQMFNEAKQLVGQMSPYSVSLDVLLKYSGIGSLIAIAMGIAFRRA